MIKFRVLGLGLFILLPLSLLRAEAAKRVVQIEREYSIEGLSIKGESFKILTRKKGGKKSRYIRLRGKFKRKGWALKFKKKSIIKRKSKRRTFSLRIPVKKKKFKLKLRAIGPGRKKETEVIVMRVVKESVEEIEPIARKRKRKREVLEARNEKNWYLSVGIGATILNYTETIVSDYNGILVTPKIGFGLGLHRKWDFSVEGFYNAFAVSNSPIDSKIQFLGIDGRVGYMVLEKPRFKIKLSTGLYFITSSATSDTLLTQTGSGGFGFKNFLGLQFYPNFYFALSDRNTIMLYGKYSPALGLGLSDRELAFGVYFIHKLRNNNRISFGIDYADTRFELATGSVGRTAINIGLGYTF